MTNFDQTPFDQTPSLIYVAEQFRNHNAITDSLVNAMDPTIVHKNCGYKPMQNDSDNSPPARAPPLKQYGRANTRNTASPVMGKKPELNAVAIADTQSQSVNTQAHSKPQLNRDVFAKALSDESMGRAMAAAAAGAEADSNGKWVIKSSSGRSSMVIQCSSESKRNDEQVNRNAIAKAAEGMGRSTAAASGDEAEMNSVKEENGKWVVKSNGGRSSMVIQCSSESKRNDGRPQDSSILIQYGAAKGWRRTSKMSVSIQMQGNARSSTKTPDVPSQSGPSGPSGPTTPPALPPLPPLSHLLSAPPSGEPLTAALPPPKDSSWANAKLEDVDVDGGAMCGDNQEDYGMGRTTIEEEVTRGLTEDWGWRREHVDDGLSWLAEVLQMMDQGDNLRMPSPHQLVHHSVPVGSTADRPEYVFVSRLRQMALLSDPDNYEHGISNAVSMSVAGCLYPDCPRRHPDCKACQRCIKENPCMPTVCPTCSGAHYCSQWCLGRDASRHMGTAAQVKGPSECLAMASSVQLFIKSIQCEGLPVRASMINSSNTMWTQTNDMDDSLKKAANRRFVLVGCLPPLFLSHYIAKRVRRISNGPPVDENDNDGKKNTRDKNVRFSISSLLRQMVIDKDHRLDEILTYLVIERFLESNFSDFTFFYRTTPTTTNPVAPVNQPSPARISIAATTGSAISSPPPTSDSKSVPPAQIATAKLIQGSTLETVQTVAPESSEMTDKGVAPMVGGENEALRVTSETTLRLFAGMEAVCCIGCGIAVARRNLLWLCPMCGLATCCRLCNPQFHRPSRCGYISSLIEAALQSRSLQFSPTFSP